MIKAIKRWMFGKSRRRYDFDVEARYLAELALIEGGWRSWLSHIGTDPWDYAVIEIRRLDGPVTITAYEDIPKEMNGIGLYWRPWNGATLDGRRHELRLGSGGRDHRQAT